jgi:hypothetical protein
MINEKPILMSTPMVKAILDCRKTQTRRNLKDQHITYEKRNKASKNLVIESPNDWDICMTHKPGDATLSKWNAAETKLLNTAKAINPYGQTGDLLWVKENFSTDEALDHVKPSNLLSGCPITYSAGGTFNIGKNQDLFSKLSDQGKTRPCIFLPKIFSRIFLMVESISLERLLDISEEDAIAEGVKSFYDYMHYGSEGLLGKRLYADYITGGLMHLTEAYMSFMTLWDSINGLNSTKANPWVWVVKYRILSTSGRPSDEVIAANQKGLLAPILI